MLKNFFILFVTATIIAVVQCGGAINESYDRELLESMADDIYELIGDKDCDDVDNCRLIGFGSKPCGGPWELLIYSISVTDSALLAKKVRAYNKFQDRMNHKYGAASDCGGPYVPIPDCVEGACVDIRGR